MKLKIHGKKHRLLYRLLGKLCKQIHGLTGVGEGVCVCACMQNAKIELAELFSIISKKPLISRSL